MKKLILFFAAILIVSLTAVNAQQSDTTNVQTNDPTKDMVQIQARDLPAPVQQTLSSSSYTGWESGEIFRNQKSDQFIIRVNEGAGVPPKYYYFNKEGKAIKTP